MLQINETPIIISDSELSVDGPDDIKNKRDLQRSALTDNKMSDIQNWLDNVNEGLGQDLYDMTTYTELSTIYGDTGDDEFKAKEKGDAINSTFANNGNKKFNELFKTTKQNKHETVFDMDTRNINETSSSFQNLIIDDSLEESFNTRLKAKVTVRKKSNEVVHSTNNSCCTTIESQDFTNVQKLKTNMKTEENIDTKSEQTIGSQDGISMYIFLPFLCRNNRQKISV